MSIALLWCGIRAKNEKFLVMVNFFFTYHAELMMAIFFLMVLFFKWDKLLVMVNFLLTYFAELMMVIFFLMVNFCDG